MSPRRGALLLPWIVACAILAADAYLSVRTRRTSTGSSSTRSLPSRRSRHCTRACSPWRTPGFMAIGAYTSAILAVKLGLPVVLSLPVAMLLCGLVAVVIGLPVLRLTDVYLAICTLGFGEVVRILIVLLPGLTGGPTGANCSTGVSVRGDAQDGQLDDRRVLALLVYLFWTMSRSRTGRAFRAMRERELAASTMGIDLVAYRSLAFLMSAMIAGAAGAFYAHSVGSLDNGDFRFTRAVDILGYAVVGVSCAWFGPLLGAGLLTALPILLRDVLGASVGFLRNFAQLPNILTGAALVLVIVFFREGDAGLLPARGHQRRAARSPRVREDDGKTVTTAWSAARRRAGRFSRCVA